MIATLSGTVTEKFLDSIVVENGGIGYELYVTSEDYGSLQVEQDVRLYVYEHIREQLHDLFGFLALDTKLLFEQLMGVNGVGPKMALSVLSVGSGGEVRTAIASGDTKFISQASGVGKRVAERIVVDLKDHVGLEGIILNASGFLKSEQILRSDEAVEALVVLGYTPQDAAKALQGVDPQLKTEERVKHALKGRP